MPVASTSIATLCPTCRVPLPTGTPATRCPTCLIEIGLSPSSPAKGRRPLPTVDDLLVAFPDLTDLQLIGAGGMGAVFRGRQRSLGRDVAIKVVPVGGTQDDPAFDERFLRESRTLARLHHPRVVTVFSAGRAGSLLYILMELVEGESLRELLADGPLSLAETVRLTGQLCEGLGYAHDRGVIHRDVKPENILIDAAGNVKVIDFGIARIIDDAVAPDLNLTGPADRMGTTRYMAPEQLNSGAERQEDHRADVYAVGIVLYEMLVGTPPTVGSPPASIQAGVSRRVDGVISRCVAERPADRYALVRHICRDLEELSRSEPGGQRRRLAAAVVAAALATTAIAFAVRFAGIGWFASRPVVSTSSDASSRATVHATAGAFAAGSPADVLTSHDWTWSPPRNLGPTINTADIECQPCLSADGRTLVFESDRPGGLGRHDLWITRRASDDGDWTEPVNLGPGINSDGMDLNPCLSADGRTLVFCRGTLSGATKSGDENAGAATFRLQLWTATRAAPTQPDPNPPWSAVTPMEVGIANASCPYLSTDGRTLYFSVWSESPIGPVGNLYCVRRSSPAAPWQPPQRITAPDTDPSPSPRNPFITSDDLVLMWATGTSRGAGKRPFEFRMAVRATPTARFGPPQPLGRPLHGNAEDIAMTLSADARTLIFDSNREGGAGAQDLWISRRISK